MKSKKNIFSALSFFMMSLSTSVNAEPSQISLETIKNVDGKRFWQSEIQCNNKPDLRYIEKQIDNDQWCLQLSPTVCFSTKTVAANKICSDDYDGVILATKQLTDAITSTPIAATTISTPAPVNNNLAAGFIEEDDDDDSYFDIDDLIAEKLQLESELSQMQQKRIELNRRKTELQNSLLSN